MLNHTAQFQMKLQLKILIVISLKIKKGFISSFSLPIERNDIFDTQNLITVAILKN